MGKERADFAAGYSVPQMVDSKTETSNILQTAYYIAQSDHPYTDHVELIKSQVLNGVNVKHVLHSNVTCTDIINHYAMRCYCTRLLPRLHVL